MATLGRTNFQHLLHYQCISFLVLYQLTASLSLSLIHTHTHTHTHTFIQYHLTESLGLAQYPKSTKKEKFTKKEMKGARENLCIILDEKISVHTKKNGLKTTPLSYKAHHKHLHHIILVTSTTEPAMKDHSPFNILEPVTCIYTSNG